MKLEIWADFCDPFSCLGVKTLRAAMAQLGVEKFFEIEMKSYETAPQAGPARPLLESWMENFGYTEEKARRLLTKKLNMRAEKDGLDFDCFRAVVGNTFDAHRLSKFALSRGVDITDRLFDACFRDGKDLSDHAVLKSLAVEAGLDGKDTEAVLHGSDYAADVRRDEDEAARFGIRAVPYFGVDRKYGMSGLKSLTLFRYALKDLLRKAQIEYSTPAEAEAGE